MNRPSFPAAVIAATLALAGPFVGCDDGETPPPVEAPPVEAPPVEPPDPATVEFEAPPPPIPRLTNAQYRNSIATLFGDDIVVPPAPTIDLRSGGLLTVGAGDATLSPRGVENLENAAYAVAGQVLDPDHRDRALPCPADEAGCLGQFVETWGRRIWRRPLTEAEITRLVTVGEGAADVLGDAAGFEYALAAMLQSPHFIFRRERPTDAAGGPYDGYAMAARLSFLLWNTTPDDALLDAAERGELTADDTLRGHVEAMLDDPRARDGLLEFFSEWLGLDALDELRKDPTVYTAMSPEVAPAARNETLTGLEELVFVEDGDFRGFIDGRRTYVDRKLASIYGVRAPAREGFAPLEMPTYSGRRGFLGQVSFLAANSHPTSTSATLRGKFVREKLLCHVVPPPPSDVDTSIPEPSGTTRTLRERVAEHLDNPSCAGCHRLMDGVGLAFENFDGLGTWRDTDNEAPIDASGELDGTPFADADELAGLIAAHPDFPTCVTRYVTRYGTGQVEESGQREMIEALSARFVAGEYRFTDLVVDFVMSPAFRVAGPVAAADEAEEQ